MHVFRDSDTIHSGWWQDGFDGDMTVSIFRMAINCPNAMLGLGSVIVFTSTLFALWSGVSDGFAALVIVQAGIFADASRQLVRQVIKYETLLIVHRFI